MYRRFSALDMSKFTDSTTKQVMDIDCSMTMHSDEIRRYMDCQSTAVAPALQNRTLFPSNDSLNFTSIIMDHMQSVKEKTGSLFPHFLEVVQSRTNDSEIFETVRDLIQVCSDTIGELAKPHGRNGAAMPDTADLEWLVNERDTWRLLYALYNDRLVVQKDVDEPEFEALSLMRSEKDIVEHLYAHNANLREYQLVVDWLEQSASEQGNTQIGFYTDRTVGWENTLMQLKNADQSMFGGGKDVVRSMDPDAPTREKRRLHDLDQEDQKRLSAQILRELRKGRIEEAQSLCEHCGHPWQAAVLEGWRLHHDPNYDQTDHTTKNAIEGNPRRDLWKHLAWRTADRKNLDVSTRAIVGILCGHLQAAIAPLSQSWADLLWAYLKVQIDIRVESEIRSSSSKSHLDMPDAYWSGKMTLENIFDELEAHDNGSVNSSARNPMNIIQKYLILDNIPGMMKAVDGWLAETSLLDAQMLRFLTHVVLFMRQVGRSHQDDVADRVIKSYVECLIEQGDAQLVAFYTAAVPVELQTVLYSKFLKTLNDSAARRAALDEGQRVGLDVAAIARYTVETIRLEPDADMFESDKKQQTGSINAMDARKISALEWLTFYGNQDGELLWQANAMIRTFLAESKIECLRMAFEMIPSDTIGHIVSRHGGKDELPYREECSMKEYLCFQSYLGALDSYNDWTRLFHSKPKEPKLVGANAAFTERMASEHKEQAYKSDVMRWNISLQEQTRITRGLMFNVLLFPEKGFLVDPELVDADAVQLGPEWNPRQVQLDNLRKLCIPEMVLLLHQILHQSGDFQQCVRLADELVDERRQLYAVYPKHKLTEIIAKIAESSLALMNEKLDPWGYTITA